MYKARTTQDYEAARASVVTTKAADWRLLTREMLYSEAFKALTKGGIFTVLLMLDKLRYEVSRKDRKAIKRKKAVLKDNGEFTVPINELISFSISKASATRGRDQAWMLGFFDVIDSGTIHHIGRYRYSERWKLYPNGDYQPHNQQPPGMNVYPDNNFSHKQQKLPMESQSNVGDESIFLDNLPQ